MKKASIEVGVNFLVVTIICLALLGIGIFLMSKFVIISQKQLGAVDDANQQRLIKLLSAGAQVTTIPSIAYINRGETTKFSLGISNELGYDTYFSIYVKLRSWPTGANDLEIIPQYMKTATSIKNNLKSFMLIAITIPKNQPKGTYVFNIYVCKEVSGCYENPQYNDPYYTDKYGELQQIQVNVK